MLLRYHFVEEFKRFYQDAHAVQVKNTIAAHIQRKDVSRENEDNLISETLPDRTVENYSINTNQSLDDTFRKVKELCNTLL